MRRSTRVRIIGLTAAVLVMPVLANAAAAEAQEAAGRTISYRTAVEVLERDAENKPLKGTAERVGVTLHEAGPGAGTVSQVRILSTWERKAKGGVYSGTLHRTFADGGRQDIVFQGRFKKGSAEGTYECTGGTGKYASATCGGTYASQSFKNGMSANQWTGTIAFKE